MAQTTFVFIIPAVFSMYLTHTAGYTSAAHVGNTPREEPAPDLNPRSARIKVYFVNVESSVARRACAQRQLSALVDAAADIGVNLSFARYPAVTFKSCTDADSCIKEKPYCFPHGVGYIHHGLNPDAVIDYGKMYRGVLANWCSHRLLFEEMLQETHQQDYFLVLEDDILLSSMFMPRLKQFLTRYPDHWSLVAMDTFSFAKGGMLQDRFPAQDSFNSETSYGMKLFSISATKNSYWGAHAWLLNGRTMHRFVAFFNSVPATPLDWVTKATHPSHLGIWAFQPGAILQRQQATPHMLDRLTSTCRSVDGSDIEGTSEKEPALQLLESPALIPGAPEALEETKPLAGHLSPAPSQPSEVVILSLMEGGATIVEELIYRNLEAPNNMTMCKRGPVKGCNGVWPHTHPKRLEGQDVKALRGGQDFTEAVAIIVVRHPFSQIRAMQKRISKKGMKCGQKNGSADMGRPCSFEGLANTPAMLADAPCEMGTQQEGKPCWESLLEAWNSYADGYRQLLDGSLFKEVVAVRYEDLLESPEFVLDRIAKAVGAPLPDSVHVSQEVVPVDEQGNLGLERLNRAEALSKLKVLDYNANFLCHEMKELCHILDQHLVFSFAYHACQSHWPGYDELIFRGTKYAGHRDLVMKIFDKPETFRCFQPSPPEVNPNGQDVTMLSDNTPVPPSMEPVFATIWQVFEAAMNRDSGAPQQGSAFSFENSSQTSQASWTAGPKPEPESFGQQVILPVPHITENSAIDGSSGLLAERPSISDVENVTAASASDVQTSAPVREPDVRGVPVESHQFGEFQMGE